MICYEDAQKIREYANAPLTWDETIPAPPIDRIELTRRILETAEAVGLHFPAWNESLPFDDPDRKMEAFQEIMRRTIPSHKQTGVPTASTGGVTDGMIWDGYRPLNGGEYIEWLELDYFGPWETAWRFGACAESAKNVLSLTQSTITLCYTKYEDVKVGLYSYENTLKENAIIGQYVSIDVGWHLSDRLQWDVFQGSEFSLIVERWMGLPDLVGYFLPLVIGLFVCAASVIGAVCGLYSGWLLFVIIPAVVVISLLLMFSTIKVLKKHWIDKTLTFAALAEKVVTLKKHEWAELQRTYTA